jgi:hypothetical protein
MTNPEDTTDMIENICKTIMAFILFSVHVLKLEEGFLQLLNFTLPSIHSSFNNFAAGVARI